MRDYICRMNFVGSYLVRLRHIVVRAFLQDLSPLELVLFGEPYGEVLAAKTSRGGERLKERKKFFSRKQKKKLIAAKRSASKRVGAHHHQHNDKFDYSGDPLNGIHKAGNRDRKHRHQKQLRTS